MANNIAGKVSAARKAGYTDDQIAAFLQKDPNYGQAFGAALKEGYSSSDILNHFQPEEDAPAAAPDLKPNNELGFLNGGTQVFNNILGAGSKGLQAAGVPANVVHGTGKLIRDPFGPLVPGSLPNKDQVAALNQKAAGVGQRPGKLGVVAGQVAGTIPAAVGSAALAPEALGIAAPRALTPVLNALAGRGLSGAVVQGAEQGLQTTNKTDAGGVAADAGLGGLGGLGGQLINNGVGAFVAPRFGAAMNTLLKAGQKKFSLAELTGNAQIKKVEDAVRSMPLLGGLVEGAQGAAEQDFNRAYLQQVSDKGGLGVKVAKPTQDTYGDLKGAFKQEYGSALNAASVAPDAPFLAAPQHAVAMDEIARAAGKNDLSKAIRGMFPSGGSQPLNGSQVKEIDQLLRQEAKSIRNPGGGKVITVSDNARAEALDAARGHLRDALSRQQPDVADRLGSLDQAYAMFKRAQEASTGLTGKVDPGLFTPQALKNATYKAPGAAQRATLGSSGDIPGQELVDAATKVMGSRVADSGTAFRSAVNKLISPDAAGIGGAGAAGILGKGLIASHPLSAGTAAALYGAYLPVVRDAITNTVVGNSKNKLLQAARKALDEQAANNVARRVTSATVGAPFSPEVQ